MSPTDVPARYAAWSHAVAGSMTNASSLLYDDLVQESMIEVWQIAEKKGANGAGATYLTRAAKHRMVDVLLGKRPMTGSDSSPGPKYRPTAVGVDWSAVEQEDDGSDWADLLEAPDRIDSQDWVYHGEDFREALDELRPDHRDFVVRKFWQGKTNTEIAAEMGVDKRLLTTWWRRTIKPALQGRLAHLEVA